LPAIFGFREFPVAGGLMSYGADLADQHRTMGGMWAAFSRVKSLATCRSSNP
jgi:hypothetical protein